MEGIRYWIETEGTGHWFFVAFPIILLCLFIWLKSRRLRFLVPSLLVTIMIVNPWFYEKWTGLGLYAYWRILWVVPVIPVLASIVPNITERINSSWIKMVAVVIGMGLVVLGGTFLYTGIGGVFVEAANASKLPDNVVMIADKLLELDEHPRVIVQDPIGVYMRQYSGNITTLFGRDLHGYIFASISNDASTANNEISDLDSDLSSVHQIMLDDGYNYLVMNRDAGDGFELVDNVGDYRIFKAVGIPTVIKERNALGQVTALTLLDEQGKPTNGENGYSTLHREYDEYGNITYEFYTDTMGNGILVGNERAGYEREYDSEARVISERNLGADGETIRGSLGYAEIRRIYQGDKLIIEQYLDTDGQLINCINGYAVEEFEYDGTGNLIAQRYRNYDGDLVVAASGFAEKRCKYDNGKLIREAYFGAGGEPLIQARGYVSIEQTWLEGKVISRSYYGLDGQPVNCIDGYSKVVWSSGEEGGTRSAHFYDLDGNELRIDGINLAVDIGSDSWTEWFAPDVNNSNYSIYIGSVTLDEKKAGDMYTCLIEVEFSNVTGTQREPFRFSTQGRTDGTWKVLDPWTRFVWVTSPPNDGIYEFYSTRVIDEEMANSEEIEIGFRCDYWNSGKFRIKNIRIEKGDITAK